MIPPIIFSVTLFVSASLLFVVQPMMGKLILPILGGAPAVWNTSVMFFQFVLLAGYGYAHLLAARLSVRRQVLVHLLMLGGAALTLPLALRGGGVEAAATPTASVVVMLAWSVGLPVMALSATAPLLQRWYSTTSARSASDPFFLYAASNAGSLLALLSYPFLIEPAIGLALQQRLWSGGFVLLGLLMGVCAWSLWGPGRVDARAAAPERASVAVSAGQRLRWLLLAFIPSSLMLSVTTFATTDVAPVPLFWVVPLALYLLTFVLAFANRRVLPVRLVDLLFPFLLVASLGLIATGFVGRLDVVLPVHVAAFFAGAYLCHARLYDERPDATRLTEFYLWISVGGLLGGVMNTLVAPVLFVEPHEHLLGLIVVAGLRAQRWRLVAASPVRHLVTAAVPIVFFSLTLLVPPSIGIPFTRWGMRGPLLTTGVPLVASLAVGLHPLRFALALTGIGLAGGLQEPGDARVVHRERTFFGTHIVTETDRVRRLLHGTTDHGAQPLSEFRRCDPGTYFTRSGPVGALFQSFETGRPRRRVGVAGLGVGTLAAYATPGQDWTFFEINPAVGRIATNPAWFTYLGGCLADYDIVYGDARLTIAAQPDASFDLLVLDAFSSDAVPMHLLTREALALYLQKLAEGGVIAFQITNRHLNLAPALGRLAREAGLWALLASDNDLSDPQQAVLSKYPSDWIVIARTREDLGSMMNDSRFVSAPTSAGAAWTDDYSNVVQALMGR